MLDIVILDDDINICNKIEDILNEYSINNYLKFNIEIFYSGVKFLECLKKGRTYDILFLDIEIDDLTGVDIGNYIRKELKNEIIKIVYISSHTNYAMSLFKVRPIDFLIKPIDKREFIKVIDILLNLINNQYEYFEFNLGFSKNKIFLKDIVYFTTIKESKKIFLKTTKEEFIFYGKIKDIYNFLEKYRFIQPFNSYIVNYDYVKTIEKDKVILFNQEEIPLSRHKAKEVKLRELKFIKEI